MFYSQSKIRFYASNLNTPIRVYFHHLYLVPFIYSQKKRCTHANIQAHTHPIKRTFSRHTLRSFKAEQSLFRKQFKIDISNSFHITVNTKLFDSKVNSYTCSLERAPFDIGTVYIKRAYLYPLTLPPRE